MKEKSLARLLERRNAKRGTGLAHSNSFGVTGGELWQLEQAVLDAEDLPRPQVQIESLRGLLEKLRRISEGTSND